MDLMSISTFVKYASEVLLGLPSKMTKVAARTAGKDVDSIPVYQVSSTAVARDLRAMVMEIFSHVSQELVKAFKDYKSKEKKCEADRVIHGTLSDQKQSDFDGAKKLFERLLGVVTVLAESLGEDIPLLEEDKDEDDADANTSRGITLWDGGSSAGEYNGPFTDSDSRSFYEDLPDLLAAVPLSFLGLTQEQAVAIKEQWKVQKESKYAAPSGPSEITNDDVDDPSTLAEAVEPSTEELVGEKDDVIAGEADVVEESSPQARLLLLIQDKLPECTTKAKCDEFCISFCHLNSKVARKKLAQALIKIPYGRSDLVSSFARIVASLHRLFTDIAPVVLESMQRELTFLSKSKVLLSYGQVEAKCRILRYLGELIKFTIAPPIMALKSLRAFLGDFQSNNIDFATVLLESCGRFVVDF